MYLSGDGRLKVTATPDGNTKAVVEGVKLGRHSPGPLRRRGSSTLPSPLPFKPRAFVYWENLLRQ